LRLAFVTVGDTGRLTGGHLYNRRLLEGLGGKGIEAEVIVPCGAGLRDQARAAAVFGGGFDPSRFDAAVVDALARAVVAPHLDHWRSHLPVVALVHELPGAANPPVADRELPFEMPLLRSDRLVAVSGYGREILLRKGVPDDKVSVVQPGFDRLAPVERSKRVPGRAARVLCVAQWIPRKGILELVLAWRERERFGAVLELVGETDADPDYAASIVEAAADDPSILIHGPVDDAALSKLYASADLFALPSRYEGYGMVFAEALSFGLPILACRVGPVPEIVGEEAALLVPPENPDALAGAVDRLLLDGGLRKKMSTAAACRAENLPRWSDTVDGFLAVLRDAAGESRR
jgi:glycosyltransferase involved in cell wall biosynthesis